MRNRESIRNNRRWSAGCFHTQGDWKIGRRLIGELCANEWREQEGSCGDEKKHLLHSSANFAIDQSVKPRRLEFVVECALKTASLLYAQNRHRQFQTTYKIQRPSLTRSIVENSISANGIYDVSKNLTERTLNTRDLTGLNLTGPRLCYDISHFAFQTLAKQLGLSQAALHASISDVPGLWPKPSYGTDSSYELVLYETKKPFFMESEHESLRIAILFSPRGVRDLLARTYGISALVLETTLRWTKMRMGSYLKKSTRSPSVSPRSPRQKQSVGRPRPRLLSERGQITSYDSRLDLHGYSQNRHRVSTTATTNRARISRTSPRSRINSLSRLASNIESEWFVEIQRWSPRCLTILMLGFISFCEQHYDELPRQNLILYDYKLLENCCEIVATLVERCRESAMKIIRQERFDHYPLESVGWIYDTLICRELLSAFVETLKMKRNSEATPSDIMPLVDYLYNYMIYYHQNCKVCIEEMLKNPAQLQDICLVPKTYQCPQCRPSLCKTKDKGCWGHLAAFSVRGASHMKRQNANVIWRCPLGKWKDPDSPKEKQRKVRSEHTTPRSRRYLRNAKSSICLSSHRHFPKIASHKQPHKAENEAKNKNV